MYLSRNIQRIALLAFTASAALFSCQKKSDFVPVKDQKVVSSEWLATEMNNKSIWKEQTNQGIKCYTCEFNVPSLTEELLQNSAILVYGKLYGYKQSIWPDEKVGLLSVEIYHNEIGGSLDRFAADVTPGKIKIKMTNSQGLFPDEISSENQFRLIVIPKSALVTTGYKTTGNNPLGRYSEGELRELPYDQICTQAGLTK